YDAGYQRRDWPTEKDLDQPGAAHATANRVHDERPDRRTDTGRAEKKAQAGRRPGHQARPPLAKFWWLAGEAVVSHEPANAEEQGQDQQRAHTRTPLRNSVPPASSTAAPNPSSRPGSSGVAPL